MSRAFFRAVASAALCLALRAQAPRTPEPLTAWPFFKEVRIPVARAGLLDFVLDREMLNMARVDHADVRLYDGSTEVPYVLRVRRTIETREAFSAREFNRSSENGVEQVSFDLGANPQEHNEVEIQTAGTNFRRLADVQGSSDGAQWFTLASSAILFRFTSAGRTVEQQAAGYP
jgi:hypothetical protein